MIVYVSFSAEINVTTTEQLLGAVFDQVNAGATGIYLLLSTPGGFVDQGVNAYNVLNGLYPGFATDDEVFPDPKRCRYRTGTAERKYGEFGRFLHKRIDGIESVAGQGWTAHGQSVDFAASGDRVHRARTAATSWKPLVG